METHELVDVNEGTRLTGLDKGTLYKLARQGRLPSFKVLGTALRFRRSDLMALVQENQTARPAGAPSANRPSAPDEYESRET